MSRCGEARDFEQRVAPFRVLVEALFDDRAEILPDFGEFLLLALGKFAKLLNDAVGDAFADRRKDGALLDHLARDVERKVDAVDDEADEAQPTGKKIGVLADQHPPHIELVAALSRRIEEIKGS